MLKTKFVGIVMLIALLMPFGGVQAQNDSFSTPQAMLQTYYDAINRRDFTTAYSLQMIPTQTPEEFQEGFWRTNYVTPYFGVFDMDTTPISGRVQAVLVAQETDYSVERAYSFSTYAGCFRVERTTPGTTWKISSSDFAVVIDHGQRPATSTINELLNRYCTDNLNTVNLTTMANIPQDEMLQIYWSSVNSKNYENAYYQWLQPLEGPLPNGGPPEDYRPAYDDFVAGYANTRFVSLYTGNYDMAGASAGKSYLNGLMPVVLVAETEDNRFETYAGCYVIGYKPDGTYGIVNGRLFAMDNNVPLGFDILEYLNTSCIELAIPN